jgi:hypothetical protein
MNIQGKADKKQREGKQKDEEDNQISHRQKKKKLVKYCGHCTL